MNIFLVRWYGQESRFEGFIQHPGQVAVEFSVDQNGTLQGVVAGKNVWLTSARFIFSSLNHSQFL